MPNGGFDNCGTCWFNTKNKGEVGHEHISDAGADYCSIRNLAITGDAFHTYCANNPYNTTPDPEVDPRKIDVPIGPVFKAVNVPEDTTRTVWIASPDSAEIRLKLLALLATIEEQPLDYGGNMPWDDMVIWQLGEFREQRALDNLKRIATFNPATKAAASATSRGFRTRQETVRLAQEAANKIQTNGENI